MTYKTDFTLPDELLEQIVDRGLDVLPGLIRTIINTAMQRDSLTTPDQVFIPHLDVVSQTDSLTYKCRLALS